jgi:hypothetical protein
MRTPQAGAKVRNLALLLGAALLGLYLSASLGNHTANAAGIFNSYDSCPSSTGSVITQVSPGPSAACVNWFSDAGAGSGNPITISTDVGTLTESSCFTACGSPPSGNGTSSVVYDPASDSPFGFSGDLVLAIVSCTKANVTITISQNGNSAQSSLACSTPSPGVGIFNVYPSCPSGPLLGQELSSVDPGTHTACVNWFVVAGAGSGQPFTVSTSLGTLEHFSCFPACNNTGGDGTATLSFDPDTDSPFGYSGDAWLNIPACTSSTVTFTIVQEQETGTLALPCLTATPTPTKTSTPGPTSTPTSTQVPVIRVVPAENQGALAAALAAAAGNAEAARQATAEAAAQQTLPQTGAILPPSTGDAGVKQPDRTNSIAVFALVLALAVLATGPLITRKR